MVDLEYQNLHFQIINKEERKPLLSTLHPALNIREQIVGVNQPVPLLNGTQATYINFDNAASTPALKKVLDSVNQFMVWYSSVHRGSGFKSQLATEVYEEARQIVARFVGANPDQHLVIFGKNTTEALNKLAYRFPLQKDDIVLVSLLEHHSNDLPWRAQAQVVRIGLDESGRLDEADFERKLAQYAGRVKLVAVTGAANVTGYLPDIHSLARKAHIAGAQILVDAAQLAPHRPIQMGGLNDPAHLDYLTISAHKMYAPFGTGALIGRRDTFEQGEPEYRGGGTIAAVSTEAIHWAAAPDRDEAGSPNVVGAVALAAAIKAIGEIGMEQIAQHEAQLTEYALQKMSQIEGITLYGMGAYYNPAERVGVIPFNLSGKSDALVAAILSAEWGIGVRNGCFCAHPYVLRLLNYSEVEIDQAWTNMVAGDMRQKPGMVRVSFGMYNTFEEVDVLVAALSRIARDEYFGQYEQDVHNGEYRPLGWAPNLHQFFSL
jgi:selenocysteine lyase/cysteine desulfurase